MSNHPFSKLLVTSFTQVIAKLFLLLAMLGIFGVGTVIANGRFWDYGALILTITVVSCVAGILLMLLNFDAGNKSRDKIAAKLVESRISSVKLILYLRPFVSDSRLPRQANPFLSTLNDMLFFGLGNFYGFESGLVSSEKTGLRVIRIGGPKPESASVVSNCALPSIWMAINRSLLALRLRLSARAGTVYVDAWQPMFLRLVKWSSVCILIPPHRDGTETAWELDRLIEADLLKKTILVMPRSGLPTTFSLFPKVLSPKLIWKKLVNQIGEREKLPCYSSLGGLWVPCVGGAKLVQGVGGYPWDSSKALSRILDGGELTTSPNSDAIRISIYSCFIVPIIATLVYFISQEQTSALDVDRIMLAVPITFGATFSIYIYCGRFLLSKWRRRVIFLGILFSISFSLYLLVQLPGGQLFESLTSAINAYFPKPINFVVGYVGSMLALTTVPMLVTIFVTRLLLIGRPQVIAVFE